MSKDPVATAFYQGRPVYKPGPNVSRRAMPFPDWDGSRFVDSNAPAFEMRDDSSSLQKKGA